MKILIASFLILAMIVGLTAWNTEAIAAADPVSQAYGLCKVFMATNLASNCQVTTSFTKAPSIDLTIDTTASDALDMCRQMPALIAQTLAKDNLPDTFTSEWRLRIFSPYSQRPLAVCALKQ